MKFGLHLKLLLINMHPVLPSPSSWSWVKTGNINWTTNDKAIAALPAANALQMHCSLLVLFPYPALGALAIQNNV